MWLLEIDCNRKSPKFMIFFLTLHHRERFLEFMYFLMHIFKFPCLAYTHTHTHTHTQTHTLTLTHTLN